MSGGCPSCGRYVGRRRRETAARALGSFLSTDQVEALSASTGEIHGCAPEALCGECLLELMAELA